METNQKLKLQKNFYISILLTKMKIILFLSILVKELKCTHIYFHHMVMHFNSLTEAIKNG